MLECQERFDSFCKKVLRNHTRNYDKMLRRHMLRQWPCSLGAESDAGRNWHWPCQGCPRTQAKGAARLAATYD